MALLNTNTQRYIQGTGLISSIICMTELSKTYIFDISTLPKSIRDKNDGEKALISLKNRFLVPRNNVRHTFPTSD